MDAFILHGGIIRGRCLVYDNPLFSVVFIWREQQRVLKEDYPLFLIYTQVLEMNCPLSGVFSTQGSINRVFCLKFTWREHQRVLKQHYQLFLIYRSVFTFFYPRQYQWRLLVDMAGSSKGDVFCPSSVMSEASSAQILKCIHM